MLKKRFIQFIDKKGFAIQFNWLFVLIGGAIILGFFISLIVNQVAQEEKKSAQESTLELDELLKVSAAMSETEKVASLGKVDKKINFYCDETSEYLVEGAFKPGRYDYNAIFSPDELDAKELVILTLSFNAPFKIMPIVYVTDEDIEYVFVGNAPVLNLIFSLMPQNATKKTTSSGTTSSYKNNNYDHTVFIVTNENDLARLDFFTSENDYKKIFGVVIKPLESAINYGELAFYTYDETGFVLKETLPYFDIKSDARLVLGGVISHNADIYKCNLRKMLQRLDLLTKLYNERLLYYTNVAPDHCKSYYATAKGYADTMQSYAEKQELLVNDFKNLVLAINNLDTLNAYLVSSEDCPRIY